MNFSLTKFIGSGALENQKNLKSFDRRIIYSLSFLLPFLCMIIIYAMFKIYPFGNNTVLTYDLNGQYSIFLQYLRDVLLGKESLFYSFSKGMGGSMYGTFTYYVSSPFSVLMLAFPPEAAPEGIALIITLKTACCGLTFSMFLRHVFGKSDLSVVLFSCCYALCGYMMNYSMCIMWLDSVIWLPIILLGVERILAGKSGWLFLTVYAINLLSNYYTAYMSTIFVVLYFFSCYFALNESIDKKDLLSKTLKMLTFGVLGLLLSAVVIIPSFADVLIGRGTWKNADNRIPDTFLNTGIAYMPKHLFFGQFDTLYNEASPAVFCGTLVGIMISVFFFNPKIKLRTKISTLSVFAILLISFFVLKLDSVWHVFSYPICFPYRYAYVFSFLSVVTAFHGFCEMESVPKKLFIFSLIAYSVLIFDRILFMHNSLTNHPFAAIGVALAVIYILALLIYKYRQKFKTIVCVALLLLTCSELIVNGFITMNGINDISKYKTKKQYNSFLSETEEISDFIAGRDKSLFLRWDKTFNGTQNDSLLFGHSSATSFSSSFNGRLINMYQNLGMLHSIFTARYLDSTFITDCIFGIKYIAANNDVKENYKEIKTIDGTDIYRNPYSLPLAFTTKNSALDKAGFSSFSVFENQNRLAKAILGGNSYGMIIRNTEKNAFIDENNILEAKRSIKIYDTNIYFEAKYNGSYYMGLDEVYSDGISLIINNQPTKFAYDGKERKTFYLGEFKEGDRIYVTFEFGDNVVNKKNVPEIYCFDADKFKSDCLQKIENPGFNLTEVGNTSVKGTASLKEGEVLFTTIPFENGWRAFANGEEVEVLAAQDAFVALDLPEGEYEIELRYSVPGLKISLIISLTTLIGIIIYAVFTTKRRKIKA